jgi:exopolysaccharide/PEP-CTERM locus tyrosine autokinase
MSLVERALKKLQDSSRAGAPEKPPEVVIGSVVHAPGASQPRARRDATPTPSRSGKFIKIDREALRVAGLLPTAEHERRQASEFRQIKRPLIAAAMGTGSARVPDGQAIMVASALPGEGKTFTSINLAMSIAMEKDVSVLLVDADVPKPHISRIFSVDQELGLLDALVDESLDVESLIIPTDIPGLSILPAGRQTETATELLSSHRMRQVVESIAAADPSRIAIFDSPPLLLTSESRALAGMVGQIAVVVRAGATLRASVHDALESLGNSRANKYVGLILNQSEAAAPNVYYGYGDYYGKKEGDTA